MEALETYKDSAEKLAVLKAIESTDSMTEAAEVLDISRMTLYRKLDKHGINPSRSVSNLGFDGGDGRGLLSELL